MRVHIPCKYECLCDARFSFTCACCAVSDAALVAWTQTVPAIVGACQQSRRRAPAPAKGWDRSRQGSTGAGTRQPGGPSGRAKAFAGRKFESLGMFGDCCMIRFSPKRCFVCRVPHALITRPQVLCDR